MRFSRRRGKVERLEIPNVRDFGGTMLVRAFATFLSLVTRDIQRLHRAFELCTTSLASCTLHVGVARHSGSREPTESRKAERHISFRFEFTHHSSGLVLSTRCFQSKTQSLDRLTLHGRRFSRGIIELLPRRHRRRRLSDRAPRRPHILHLPPPHRYTRPSRTPLHALFLPTNWLLDLFRKGTFFHALTVHCCLRPDLIAASIGTKSTADVAIYFSLLRHGATRVNNDKSTSSHGATIRIGRDQHTKSPRS